MPELIMMHPDLKKRTVDPYDLHPCRSGEWERPGAEEVKADRGFNDGAYIHQTRYFNRYFFDDPPLLASGMSSLDTFGPEQARVYEERYDNTRSVTVRETYKTRKKGIMVKQYVEDWLVDAELDKYYKEARTIPKGVLVAGTDAAGGFMLYAGANPISTAGGMVFTTTFYLTTLGYGWLTDGGGRLVRWEWRDIAYFYENAPDVTVRVERSSPHVSNDEKIEREKLRRAMRYSDEEQSEYDRTHPRPKVEWASDEAYERQRAIDSAREKR